jgi:hypothetical protein
MLETPEEAKWRAEFDEAGEHEVRDRLSKSAHMNHQPQRQFAYRWLQEQEQRKRFREQQLYWYARWTLWAAVAAVVVGIVGVIVGIIGVLLAWLH